MFLKIRWNSTKKKIFGTLVNKFTKDATLALWCAMAPSRDEVATSSRLSRDFVATLLASLAGATSSRLRFKK